MIQLFEYILSFSSKENVYIIGTMNDKTEKLSDIINKTRHKDIYYLILLQFK